MLHFFIQAMKLLILPEMISKVIQGFRKYHPSLDRLVFLTQTRKVSHAYFQTKIAKMIFKVDQGH